MFERISRRAIVRHQYGYPDRYVSHIFLIEAEVKIHAKPLKSISTRGPVAAPPVSVPADNFPLCRCASQGKIKPARTEVPIQCSACGKVLKVCSDAHEKPFYEDKYDWAPKWPPQAHLAPLSVKRIWPSCVSLHPPSFCSIRARFFRTR
jgi:hypothetical protein